VRTTETASSTPVVVVEVKEEGPISHLRVAFTSASRTREALVVVEVVDVILIWVNS
jgi:hypothetical protein